MAHGPVPLAVDVEPGEQCLVAFEQLLQRVQQQALAEPPRAREEVVGALLDQAPNEGGFIDVVAIRLADCAEGLDADGQLALGHGGTIGQLPPMSTRRHIRRERRRCSGSGGQTITRMQRRWRMEDRATSPRCAVRPLPQTAPPGFSTMSPWPYPLRPSAGTTPHIAAGVPCLERERHPARGTLTLTRWTAP